MEPLPTPGPVAVPRAVLTFPKAEAGPDDRVSLVVIFAMEQEVFVCSRLQEPMHVQEEMIHGN